MITCKVCRRVAVESPTTNWCLNCHINASQCARLADRQDAVCADQQSAYVIKHMRLLAKRIKRGVEHKYCECFTTGSHSWAKGSQCLAFGTFMYQGRKVCPAHHKLLVRGYSYRFVGEPDTQQDRDQVYRLLVLAFEQAPDDGLRNILVKAMDDARNSESQGAGIEAEEPGEGSGHRAQCQDAVLPWD